MGIVTDIVDPCANIQAGHGGSSHGSCASSVNTAMGGGNKKPVLSHILPQNPPMSYAGLSTVLQNTQGKLQDDTSQDQRWGAEGKKKWGAKQIKMGSAP